MHFEYFAVLTFVVISSNIASATGGTDEEGPSAPKKRKIEIKCRCPNDKVNHVFGEVGNQIAGYLPTGDLKNMAKIPEMSECANYELNHRNRILYYRDNKITPPYLKKALELVSKMNFTDFRERLPFTMHHWTPGQAILFGEEKSINTSSGYSAMMFASHKDHLEIGGKSIVASTAFYPVEIKEISMNGVIIPYDLWSFSSEESCFWSTDFELGPVVLAIVISNDLKY
ncbi:hypothetical protein LOAG_13449, partial [Loa loa]